MQGANTQEMWNDLGLTKGGVQGVKVMYSGEVDPLRVGDERTNVYNDMQTEETFHQKRTVHLFKDGTKDHLEAITIAFLPNDPDGLKFV